MTKKTKSNSIKLTKNARYTKIRTVKLHHVGGLTLIAIAIVWGTIFMVSQKPGSSTAQACSVSSTLVNSCRAWLGAAANNYPQTTDDPKSQLLYHEQRIGRKLDVIHTYHPVGDNDLSSTDLYFANRADTYLFANWKPATRWKDATGNNTSTDAGIDKMARSIASLGSKKIFLTLNHEPENDVSGGASGCNTGIYVGSAGTPADYRAMWEHVRKRFKAVGATNVVWVMDYMNYPKWDCMVDDLYPGNAMVDWVMFNGYGVKDERFPTEVDHFYKLLSSTSNSTHDYLSKPWGIVEWGIKDPTATQAINYYNSARETLDKNTFPRLKAYMVFDARHKGAANGENYRVGFDSTGTFNQAVQGSYNAFANHPRLKNNTPPPPQSTPPAGKDTIPPTIQITTPQAAATVSGGLNIAGNAKDNIKIKAVTLRIDNSFIATDDLSPYTFRIDTTKYSNGGHTITLRAWDTANNMAEASIKITFKNSGVRSTSDKTSSKASSTIITAGTSSPGPIVAEGMLIINPSAEGRSIQLWIDGKALTTNTADSTKLTNGTHVVTINEDGVITIQTVSVKNPLPQAAVNHVQAHPLPYALGGSLILALAIGWIMWPYLIDRTTSRREKAITHRQRGYKKQ